jgi:hypothetical protein
MMRRIARVLERGEVRMKCLAWGPRALFRLKRLALVAMATRE